MYSYQFIPFSQCSFELSEYTANVDGVGTLRLLDAVRTCGLEKSVRFYQVSFVVLSVQSSSIVYRDRFQILANLIECLNFAGINFCK